MRTVVLCEHDEAGSLAIDQSYVEQTLNELITDLEGYTVPCLFWRPVQMDTAFYITT
jgi:hypothetical protein